MKQADITDAPKLSRFSMANIFNVYESSAVKNRIVYSINKTVNFSGLPSDIETETDTPYYTINTARHGDTWHILSYKTYGTIELWWILAKLNQVKDPTVDIVPGTKIRIMRKSVIESIMQSIFNVVE